jgi:competence protein ComEC
MRKPLLWLVALFSLGIIAANTIRIPLLGIYLASILFLLIAILWSRKIIVGQIALAALVFLCGMAWLNNFTLEAKDDIKRFCYNSDEIYLLRGWVNSQVDFQANQTSFRFVCQEIATKEKQQSCHGEILVIVQGQLKTEYGEELILQARLARPFGEYLRRRGISLIARVKTPDFASSTNRNKSPPLKRLILKLKSCTESKFESRLTPICAGVVEAMILGEEKNVPAAVYKDMIRSGTVHILVVSGSNVGVVGFIIVLFFKTIRVKRRLRFFLSVPLLLAYCFLTGASNPVVRATIMAVVLLFAYFVKRQADIYNSCALAGLIILILSPVQLFNIGFQLSFASVSSIAFFYPRLKQLLRLSQLKSTVGRFLAEGCLVSLSAWLGTAALIAGYFRMVSPITVLANLVIVPLATLITLSGFSQLAVLSVSSYLASSFASVNESLVSALLAVNCLLLQLPGAYFYF